MKKNFQKLPSFFDKLIQFNHFGEKGHFLSQIVLKSGKIFAIIPLALNPAVIISGGDIHGRRLRARKLHAPRGSGL